jgi:hypothetical protein
MKQAVLAIFLRFKIEHLFEHYFCISFGILEESSGPAPEDFNLDETDCYSGETSRTI